MISARPPARAFLNQFEQVALSPDVVAFAVQILARRFAFLRRSFVCCCLIQPSLEIAKRRMVSRFIRCGAEMRTLPGRRIDAEMDVLDVLQHHINRDARQARTVLPSVFALRFDDEEDALDFAYILQYVIQRRLNHLLASLNAAPAIRPHLPDSRRQSSAPALRSDPDCYRGPACRACSASPAFPPLARPPPSSHSSAMRFRYSSYCDGLRLSGGNDLIEQRRHFFVDRPGRSGAP